MALSALCNSADAAWARGDLDGAIAGFSKAVELARELPLSSADTLGVPLGNWGAALFEQGRIEQGTARIAEALRLLRKAGKAWELCDALAFRLVLQGRFRDAAQVQGYVDAVYSAASENRQPNEQRLHDRVLKRLRQEFDDPQLVQLLGMGSRLTEAMALSIAIQVGCEV
jgi:tetratricopeptide (TPR) repeat protein